MGCHTERLVDLTRELNDLLKGLEIPESNCVVQTHCDNVPPGQMEVHTDNRLGVRPKQGLITVIGFVQDTKTSIESTTGDLQSIS